MDYGYRDGKVICSCYFCSNNKEHPNRKFHDSYRKITSILLVAESLDPKDSIPVEACTTCSHVRRIENKE